MKIRAFFAADLNDSTIVKRIAKIQTEFENLDSKITFVSGENLHLTLRFLGDIEESMVPKLQKNAEEITFKPFTLEFSSVGVLPNMNYVRTLYIDVKEGFKELSSLALQVENLCVKHGFEKEKRPFKSHLTIGRVKKIGDKNTLVNLITEHKEDNFGKVEITSFTLKKSVLTPQGPIYSNLFKINAK
ncbi:MAG: RNA 2',3'-cyclic phosphodiesterase [Asgard group archaeon]|nr:RNA 2',3'-cyclic phosphodiesterase [Asgard group archaeon]